MEFPGPGDPTDDPSASEDLDPELTEYLEELEDGSLVLRHPLLFELSYTEECNQYCNAWLRSKRAAVERARVAGDWHQYLALHERPWRGPALATIADEVACDEDYWRLVADVWIDTETRTR